MKFYDTLGQRISLKRELKEYINSQERWGSEWKSRGKEKKKLWMAMLVPSGKAASPGIRCSTKESIRS